MLKISGESQYFKPLRNRYRLVVMTYEMYEDVVTFKVSPTECLHWVEHNFLLRRSVEAMVVSIVFMPLKYYIPGYDLRVGREYRQMKYRVDSLDRQYEGAGKSDPGNQKTLRGEIRDLCLIRLNYRFQMYEMSDD